MRPTLVIGLGGTGLKIGSHLKRFLNEQKQRNPARNGQGTDPIEFFFLESDVLQWNRLMNDRHLQSSMDRSDLLLYNVFNPLAYATNFATNRGQPNFADMRLWYDERARIGINTTSPGLGGIRPVGRMAIHRDWTSVGAALAQKATNISTIVSNIQQANPGNVHSVIYVIASTCGGTGSSSFLDIAAQLRSSFNNFASLIAVLVTPDLFLNIGEREGVYPRGSQSWIRYACNGAAFMRECEYFFKRGTAGLLTKMAARPSLMTGTQASSPFDTAYLFSHETSNGLEVEEEDFYPTIARMLFHAISADSMVNSASKWVNVTQNPNQVPFSTLAYLTLRYPREEFKEYFSYRYRYEVFERLLLQGEFDRQVAAQSASQFCREFRPADSHGNNGELYSMVIKEIDNQLSGTVRMDLDRALNKNQFKPVGETPLSDCMKSGVNSMKQRLTQFEDELKRCATLLSRQLDSKHNRESSLLREIKYMLHKHCHAQILKGGFYSITGTPGRPGWEDGFVQLAKMELSSNYDGSKDVWRQMSADLTRQKEGLNVAISNLEEKLKPSMFGIRKPKYDDPEIVTALQNLLSAAIRVRDSLEGCYDHVGFQLLLYYVAKCGAPDATLDSSVSSFVAQGKNAQDHPLLSEYLAEMTSAVYSSENSLRSAVYEAKDSLKKRFETDLPRSFAQTQMEAFTVYVPMPLTAYLEDGKWKKGTVIDRTFSDAVPDISTGLDVSLALDQGAVDPDLDLLPRIGSEKDDLKRRIGMLVDKIDKHFTDRWLNGDTVIKNLVNKSLAQVWAELSPQEQNSWRNFVASAVCPLRPHSGGVAWAKQSLDANCSDDTSIVNLVKTGFPNASLHKLPNYPTNEIVFVQAQTGVDVGTVQGLAEHDKIYADRDINLYRPHLRADWNDSPDGPFEQDADVIEVDLGTRGGSLSLSFLQLLALCHLTDYLMQQQGSQLCALFSTDINFNLDGVPPLHWGAQGLLGNTFCQITGGKFSVDTSSGQLNNLPLTKSNIAFSGTWKSLSAQDRDALKNALAQFAAFILTDSARRNLLVTEAVQKKQLLIKELGVFGETARRTKDGSEDHALALQYLPELRDLFTKHFGQDIFA